MKLQLLASATLALLSAVPGAFSKEAPAAVKPIKNLDGVLDDVSDEASALDDVENSNAEELNSNLQSSAGIAVLGSSNKHQCYNHCERHTSKSSQYIRDCEADCDRQYGPSPTPAPVTPYSPSQCYNLGEECNEDSDCLQGGFNPCNKCGTSHGTQYYKRCYHEDPQTPAPITPIQCYNLGEECDQDSDCWQGGTNMCTTCGSSHGTQYYKRCYGNEYEGDNFYDSDEDGPTWGDIKDGTKKAAEKTKDWGKTTFDNNSGYAAKSSDLLVVGTVIGVFLL